SRITSLLTLPHPPRPTLFPYTTLFRSYGPYLPRIDPCIFFVSSGEADGCKDIQHWLAVSRRCLAIARQSNPTAVVGLDSHMQVRSEEHTSELQSLTNLVCRLLLEKKKI